MAEKKESSRKAFELSQMPTLMDMTAYTDALLKLRRKAGGRGRLGVETEEMREEAKGIAKKAVIEKAQEKIYGRKLKSVTEEFEDAGRPRGGALDD